MSNKKIIVSTKTSGGHDQRLVPPEKKYPYQDPETGTHWENPDFTGKHLSHQQFTDQSEKVQERIDNLSGSRDLQMEQAKSSLGKSIADKIDIKRKMKDKDTRWNKHVSNPMWKIKNQYDWADNDSSVSIPENGHKKLTPKSGSLTNVANIMKRKGLSADSDEMGELAYFKATIRNHQMADSDEIKEKLEKGERIYQRNRHQLKNDFIKNMDPRNYPSRDAFMAAKERMQNMPANDFIKILNSIMADEEEEFMPESMAKQIVKSPSKHKKVYQT